MSNYEQQVTIVLTESEARCLRVGLKVLLQDHYTKLGCVIAEAHADSLIGNNAKLLDEMEQVMLGSKSQTLKQVSYKMVPVGGAE
jgi:hypothetical protein